MDCIKCGTPLANEKRDCQACGAANACPNVRIAERPAEITALAARVHDADVSAAARGCASQLEAFAAAVDVSVATISRPLGVIHQLVESDLRTYTTHAQQLRSGARVAADNRFDEIRERFEAQLFPNFSDHIRFGCLSLDGTGLAGYGPYTIVLRSPMIEERTTVFEENGLTFCERLRIETTKPIPSGYRAVWGRRAELAKAKLHSEISASTVAADYQSIVLKDRGGTADSDFIEVHIYGPLNRRTIDRLMARQPVSRADKVILKKIVQDLTALGAAVVLV